MARQSFPTVRGLAGSDGRQPERPPEPARRVEVRGRQRDLEQLAADGNAPHVPVPGRERTRLDQHGLLAAGVVEADGVELVVAQILVRELDAEPA
jgi:hypothetical protein